MRDCLSRLLLAGIACFTCACADPLVFADWTIAVPEGVRVIGLPEATEADRAGNRVELEEDLAIAARPGDDNYTFFNPRLVRVDSRGLIYVLDGGNSRIQVFDPAGEYVRTLGAEGSGPGEFRPARGGFTQVDAVVAGDLMVAYDGAQSRFSVWGPDGEHSGDHSITETRVAGLLAGVANETILAETIQRTESGSIRSVVGVSIDGELLHEYVGLPRSGNFMVGRIGLANPTGEATYTATKDGLVYPSPGDEYQILALAADGSGRWALRVARPRPPLTEEHRAHVIDALRGNFPDLDTSETEWPSHIGSVQRLAVDGHGHLYVFFMQPPFTSAPDEVAVDVYDAEGSRLFAGTMPSIRWTDAAGDFVYALRRNPMSDEDEPVRYRLVEPFE